MKIIRVDGFDRENVSDILICTNIAELVGKLIVKLLNDHSPESDFYKLVDDDHELYRFEP